MLSIRRNHLPDAGILEKLMQIQRFRFSMPALALPLAILIAAAVSAPACFAQTTSDPAATKIYKPLPGFDPSVMDPAANACVNFYQYTCGDFSKLYPIPADQPKFDEFTNLALYTRQALGKILKTAAAANAPAGSGEQKLGDFYSSCMNTADIQEKGLAVLDPELRAIDDIKSKSELAPVLARMQKLEVNSFFNIDSQQDFKDASKMIAVADQGGLGLPEKGYYLRTDAKSALIRKQYVEHLANVLKLMGEKPAQAASDANAVMAMETAMAKASMGVVARRDPKNVYHVMTVQAFAAEAPTLKLREVLSASGVPPVKTLNVAVPGFFKALQGIVQDTSLHTIKTYLRLRLVDSVAMNLPEAFDKESFHFYGHVLQGSLQQKPRAQRCVIATDANLGMLLGKFYVEKYFAGNSKQMTSELVQQIEGAMRDDLKQLNWMSPATKEKAEQKLAMVTNKVGYPKKWRDYSKLVIKPDDAMGNSLRARQFDAAYQMDKIGKPVNRNEWYMTPPTVNAYYDPSMNDINFPAGILQPPFYDKSALAATNYGHIGSVVGHELTHGFDDQGRLFDGKGNLVNWWTPQDSKNFDQRTECFVKEYHSFTPVPGLHVNGKLTLGENTADNGGLRLALMAFLADAKAKHLDLSKKVDGYTPIQHFFIAWGQNWCSTARPQYTTMLIQTNPHSPDRVRVNGVVRNMPEFGKAFNCKRGQPMYPAAAKMCRVW